ncbi:MAG: competence/damage-inducible protein A [Bacteroidales bacterium]|nr:competence/damage-inducible protein A [Bacteroidales bacterium]MDY0217287.1 competence/damage-inducible protein A [Bacteroidales bacterium]
MNANIICIGNELLNGSVVNTNATFIAQGLHEIGIKTSYISCIADDFDAIINELSEKRGIIIITGGLGPTNDDITKKCLAHYFDSKLVFDPQIYEHIQGIFQKRGMEVTELNRQQAFVIKGCKVFHNALGTAPCMYLQKNDQHIFALPGVPFEMKALMQEKIIPFLKSEFETTALYYKTILTCGIPESHLQEMLADWELSLPRNTSVAYLPEFGIIKLRIVYEGNDMEANKEHCEKEIEKLKIFLGDAIWGYDHDNFADNIGKILRKHKKTLAFAESCTGGYISHLITSNPGSSDYFKGSLVTYSNELKEEILSVDKNTLKIHGAVSEQTVVEMAKNTILKTGSDYSIAISGIAGPDGGSVEKPVGTVWIAIADSENCHTYRLNLGTNRMINIQRASISALNFLRLLLLEKLEK